MIFPPYEWNPHYGFETPYIYLFCDLYYMYLTCKFQSHVIFGDFWGFPQLGRFPRPKVQTLHCRGADMCACSVHTSHSLCCSCRSESRVTQEATRRDEARREFYHSVMYYHIYYHIYYHTGSSSVREGTRRSE